MDIIEKVYRFYTNFKGEKGIIGYTERGREIPFIKVKKTDYPIIYMRQQDMLILFKKILM